MLTKTRKEALFAAAAEGGLEWFRGDASRSRALSWLYDRKLIAWDEASGNRFVVATEAGRRALAEQAGGDR